MQYSLPFLIDAPPETPASPRHILLAGTVVSYTLKRSARRTIGLVVDESGLHATASRRVPLAEIEAFILEKQRWILKHLQSTARNGRPMFVWQEGARLPYLGEEVVLRCADISHPRLNAGTLEIPRGSADALRRHTLDWLKLSALELHRARVAEFAKRMALRAPDVGLSRARTQWGSCTRKPDGGARVLLHWKLIHFELPLIDYVVAHELAHLRHMNHSHRFWREVAQVFPDYLEARRALRERGHIIPAL